MEAELAPGDDLAKLFERSEPSRKSHEGIGQVRHQRFAFMKIADDVKLREPSMTDFFRQQHVGNDADHLSAGGERGIRYCSHEPHIAATVDNADSAIGQQSPDAFGLGTVLCPIARARAAEHADSS